MNSQSVPYNDAAIHALAEEGRAVRNFIQSNRSDTLLRLFDFLLQQSLEGRRPKEMEIAEEVFQDSHEGGSAQGSRARVGIHRLRRKLDLYYADRPGARISIPHGEYGLILKWSDSTNVEEQAQSVLTEAVVRRKITPWIAAIAFILGNGTLAYCHFNGQREFGNHVVRSTLWRGFDKDKSNKIVIGDYFTFLSKDKNGEVYEPTQDLSIHNADGFYNQVSQESGSADKIMDENSHTVSVETLESVSRLWPIIRKYKPDPVSASELNADMMKSSSIIYVGPLDALTPLISSPLFQTSQFKCAATCYELINKTSGQHFLSASPYLLGDEIIPRHDYGYIASFPGPSGKQILILSGTGDAAVRQMVSLAMDPKRLLQLGRRIGSKFSSFEALYQVRTMFSQSYQSSLLIAHPIDMTRVWDDTKPLNW